MIITTRSVKHLAPILLWLSLIFILSSIPYLGLSFRVSNGAHILVYGILAALIWAGARNRYRSNWLLITACVIPCFVFGILDELNQSLPAAPAIPWMCSWIWGENAY